MNRTLFFVTLALCLVPGLPVDRTPRAAVAFQPGASAVPAWMAGCWAGTRGSETFRERWTQADPTTLLGVSHTVKAGKMAAFEFLRVVLKDGKAVYVAQPNGVPPTEFTATSLTADLVVFENPAHDFPKRVLYQRVGADGLTASIDGGPASQKRMEYVMTREACGR